MGGLNINNDGPDLGGPQNQNPSSLTPITVGLVDPVFGPEIQPISDPLPPQPPSVPLVVVSSDAPDSSANVIAPPKAKIPISSSSDSIQKFGGFFGKLSLEEIKRMARTKHLRRKSRKKKGANFAVISVDSNRSMGSRSSIVDSLSLKAKQLGSQVGFSYCMDSSHSV